MTSSMIASRHDVHRLSSPQPDIATGASESATTTTESAKDGVIVDRTTLPERVAASIRHRIAGGQLRPQARLIETEHVALYGVSRYTLREAISILVGERLLTRTAFGGVEVTRLRAADVRDIYAARRAIELPAVDLLPTASSSVMRDLKRSIRKLASLPPDTNSSIVHVADSAIHAALVTAHESHRVSGAHAAVMAELQVLLFKTYGPDDRHLAVERHTAFESLLTSGNYRGAREQLDARLRFSEAQMVRSCEA